jgi:hypothetical protein
MRHVPHVSGVKLIFKASFREAPSSCGAFEGSSHACGTRDSNGGPKACLPVNLPGDRRPPWPSSESTSCCHVAGCRGGVVSALYYHVRFVLMSPEGTYRQTIFPVVRLQKEANRRYGDFFFRRNLASIQSILLRHKLSKCCACSPSEENGVRAGRPRRKALHCRTLQLALLTRDS